MNPPLPRGGRLKNHPVPVNLLGRALCWFLAGLAALPPAALAQAAVTISEIQINHGSPQRSSVTNITAVFTTNVSVVPSNLVLRNLGSGSTVSPTNFAVTYDSASHRASWSFPSLAAGSLPDGNYVAAILANTVTNGSGQHLDGDSNGVGGDAYVFDFFRYFGDWNGDRDVDFLDNYWFQRSREADAPIPLRSIFDDNGRGSLDAAATAHFRSNYFTLLPRQPAIFAALVNDTGDPWDHLTVDPSIAGTVLRTNPAARFQAAFQRSSLLSAPRFVDTTSDLTTNGSFWFTSNTLAQIAGEALSINDPYTLSLRTMESSGFLSSTFDLSFTIQGSATCPFSEGWIIGVTPATGLVSNAQPGSVIITPNCEAALAEGDSFLVTLERAFTLPAAPATLSFTYSLLSFDHTTTNAIKDAFEVALLDAGGNPLTYTISDKRDSFFNSSDGQPAAMADGVIIQANQVTLALHSSALGQQARLIFRLVNNDRDSRTTVPIVETVAGRPYNYASAATDPDGDALTFSLVSAPTGLS